MMTRATDPQINKILYGEVLAKLLHSGRIKTNDRILVVCGGSLDREKLLAAGFSDVTISNLDTQHQGNLTPYQWSLSRRRKFEFSGRRIRFRDRTYGLAPLLLAASCTPRDAPRLPAGRAGL